MWPFIWAGWRRPGCRHSGSFRDPLWLSCSRWLRQRKPRRWGAAALESWALRGVRLAVLAGARYGVNCSPTLAPRRPPRPRRGALAGQPICDRRLLVVVGVPVLPPLVELRCPHALRLPACTWKIWRARAGWRSSGSTSRRRRPGWACHQRKEELSKWNFAQRRVAYLGHVISEQGVGTDPNKISAITD